MVSFSPSMGVGLKDGSAWFPFGGGLFVGATEQYFATSSSSLVDVVNCNTRLLLVSVLCYIILLLVINMQLALLFQFGSF